MNGIERLEEIKSRVWKDKGTYVMGEENQREGYIYTLSDYDFEWLIQQAERVQELEEAIADYAYEIEKRKRALNKKNEQNKHYREYLELIRITGTHRKDIKTGEIIRSDEANLADEALEGEE